MHPRIAVYFPWHQAQMQAEFIHQVTEQKSVDAQAYWKFREFYSLGNFSFDPKVVTFGETQIIQALPEERNILLKYDSPRLTSTDFIVKMNPNQNPAEGLTSFIKEYETLYPISEVTYEDDRTRLYLTQSNKHVLLFVKTIDEMRSANGFFDYTGSEKKLLENTVWVNTTVFW